MTETKKTTSSQDFRGLTIFELLAIIVVISVAIFWSFSNRAKIQNQVYDEQRRGRVSTLKENLMTLVDKNGTFPSDEQFKKDASRQQIFATFLGDYGKDSLSDPRDGKILISYIAEPEGCTAEIDNPCTKVTVALKLSNGEQFIKFGVQPGKELQYLTETTQTGPN